MTIEQFKLKLKLYLIDRMDTGYDLEEITDEILLELMYEFLYDEDSILDQIYVNLNFKSFNVIMESGEYERDGGGPLLGFKRLNNMGFCGMLAGGDYEVPVFMILFFNEEGELSVYIPEKGNLYNKFTMEPYDSEETYDNNLTYKWGDIQKDIESKVIKVDDLHLVNFNKPTKKQEISQMSTVDLRKLLEDAVESEEYMKAAEIKKEIDSREV